MLEVCKQINPDSFNGKLALVCQVCKGLKLPLPYFLSNAERITTDRKWLLLVKSAVSQGTDKCHSLKVICEDFEFEYENGY